jgi:hypothetical protein
VKLLLLLHVCVCVCVGVWVCGCCSRKIGGWVAGGRDHEMMSGDVQILKDGAPPGLYL